MPTGYLVFPDTSALEALWMSDLLDRALCARRTIVVLDAVVDFFAADRESRRSKDIKVFVSVNRPPFHVHATEMGQVIRNLRRLGHEPKPNALELASSDFMSDETGLAVYLAQGDPVTVVSDRTFAVFNAPPNLTFVSVESWIADLRNEAACRDPAGGVVPGGAIP